MPVSPPCTGASCAFLDCCPNQFRETQGIIDLYVSHADNHINYHIESGTKYSISRSLVEKQILEGLDEHTFPIDMKISWYHAVSRPHSHSVILA